MATTYPTQECAAEVVLDKAVQAVECTNCSGHGRDSSEDNYGGDCPTCNGQGVVIAASATDAVEFNQDDLTQEFTLERIARALAHDDSDKYDSWFKELEEYVRVERNLAIQSLTATAQATPEDADLPQIDYVSERVAFEAAQKYTGLDLTREGHGEYISYHTHCAWGGWQDRARLAATTAAEPVHQWRKFGTHQWNDGYCDSEDGGGPYETRTLYRAAPPQKVNTGGLPG